MRDLTILGAIFMLIGIVIFVDVMSGPDLGGDANLAYALPAVITIGIALIGFIIFIIGGIKGLVQSFRGRNRQMEAYCAKCGYNLIDNTSGICPECLERI